MISAIRQLKQTVTKSTNDIVLPPAASSGKEEWLPFWTASGIFIIIQITGIPNGGVIQETTTAMTAIRSMLAVLFISGIFSQRE